MWKALSKGVFSGGAAQQGKAMGPSQLQTAPVAGESSKPALPSPGSDDLQPGHQVDQVPHPRGTPVVVLRIPDSLVCLSTHLPWCPLTAQCWPSFLPFHDE